MKKDLMEVVNDFGKDERFYRKLVCGFGKGEENNCLDLG